MECGPSKSKYCSVGDFLKTVLDAVALSSSSNCSGESNNESTRSMTESSDGSTTRIDTDGSTTRIDSNDGNMVRLESQAISLDESKAPDYSDPSEGVFYRTETDDSRTILHFVSKVFYLRLRNKIKSDFSFIMEGDVLRCTTHFRGLKCDLKIDNSASTVTISGVGHQIWREDFFPVVAKILFAQFVKLADSQVYESFDNECTDERKNTDECTTDPTREEHFAGMQPLSQAQLTASRIAYNLPVYTSTPIVNRINM